MVPRAGPLVYVPAGIAYTVIAAGASLARVAFRWPRDVFCTGMKFFALSAAPADNAALTVQIEDATFQNLFGDGQGASFALPALAVIGGPAPAGGAPQAGVGWYAMQAPIAKGDIWLFTVSNTLGEGDIVPFLGLRFEEAYDDDAIPIAGAAS